jgi:hypothetical protein
MAHRYEFRPLGHPIGTEASGINLSHPPGDQTVDWFGVRGFQSTAGDSAIPMTVAWAKPRALGEGSPRGAAFQKLMSRPPRGACGRAPDGRRSAMMAH